MDNNFQEITDLLFLGNAKSGETRHFDMIINCTEEHEVPFPICTKSICIRISIKDDPYDSDILLAKINNTQLLEQIHFTIKNKHSVLVHCSMGMQRSCAVVAFYLIKYHNMTVFESIDYIKSKRPIAFFGKVNLLQAIETFYNKHCLT